MKRVPRDLQRWPASNTSEVVRLLRRSDSATTNKFGTGGRLKMVGGIRKITMPYLKCLEPEDDVS